MNLRPGDVNIIARLAVVGVLTATWLKNISRVKNETNFLNKKNEAFERAEAFSESMWMAGAYQTEEEMTNDFNKRLEFEMSKI